MLISLSIVNTVTYQYEQFLKQATTIHILNNDYTLEVSIPLLLPQLCNLTSRYKRVITDDFQVKVRYDSENNKNKKP